MVLGMLLGILSIVLAWGMYGVGVAFHLPMAQPHFYLMHWPVLGALWLVLIAPVVEEWVFRGVIQTKLTSYMPLGIAILITSLLFTLSHANYAGNPMALIMIFVLSLLYGISRAVTGALLPGIIAHAMVNLAAWLVLLGR